MIWNAIILSVLVVIFGITKSLVGYSLGVRLTGKPMAKAIYCMTDGILDGIIIIFLLGSGLYQWFLDLLQQF